MRTDFTHNSPVLNFDESTLQYNYNKEIQMALINQQIYKVLFLCIAGFTLFSCASTKISQSWVEPNNKNQYENAKYTY